MSNTDGIWFDHEKLDVYREAIAFNAWIAGRLDGVVGITDLKAQLDRASTSISLNIAQGTGKFKITDRFRHFDLAHGAALECAAALDILVAKTKFTRGEIRPGKESLQRIVQMLVGLIKLNSTRDGAKNREG